MTSPRIAGLLCVALGIGLLAGCTAEGTANPDLSPGFTGIDAPDGAGEITLPINAYAMSTVQADQLGLARTLLTGSCMKRFGFKFDAGAVANARSSSAHQIMDMGVFGNKRRYGVVDPAVASKYGYQPVSAVEGDAEPTEAPRGRKFNIDRSKPEDVKILDSCYKNADQTLFGDSNIGENELVSKIKADSFARSVADPGVLAAFAKWSTCMKSKGYDLPDPRHVGSFTMQGRTVSAKEIQQAQADVACKQEFRVIDAWQEFETKYQNEQINSKSLELQKIKSDRDARLKIAIGVIANGG